MSDGRQTEEQAAPTDASQGQSGAGNAPQKEIAPPRKSWVSLKLKVYFWLIVVLAVSATSGWLTYSYWRASAEQELAKYGIELIQVEGFVRDAISSVSGTPVVPKTEPKPAAPVAEEKPAKPEPDPTTRAIADLTGRIDALEGDKPPPALDLGPILARIAALEVKPDPAPLPDLTPFDQRLAALESTLTSIKTRLTKLETQAPRIVELKAPVGASPTELNLVARITAIVERVDALAAAVVRLEARPSRTKASDDAMMRLAGDLKSTSERLASLEARPTVTAGDLDKITANATEAASATQTELSALETRLAEIEAGVAKAASGRERPALLVLTTGQLAIAIEGSSAFTVELNAVREAAAGTIDISGPLAILEPLAAKGVPSRAELLGTLPIAASLDPNQTEDPKGFIGRTLDRVSGLVSVKKLGDAPKPGTAEAATISGRLALAEAALARGDLAAALASVQTEPSPSPTLAAWAKAARDRLAAERAVTGLKAVALAALSKAE